MKNFINDDFLLKSDLSKKLYNIYIKDLPIIDYHCHLDPKAIYEDVKFNNITEIWLNEDHYKWRLMRANGIKENYITGNKSSIEKFKKWSETVPYLFGNPVFHWTQMELSKYFGINQLLNSYNYEEIYKKTNVKLKELSAKTLIEKSNVEVICTTDDPIDDLKYHKLLKKQKNSFRVFPSFRPDNAMNIELPSFNQWITSLSDVVGYQVDSYSLLKQALKERIKYFNEVGASVSDHGLDTIVYEDSTIEELELIFSKKLNNEALTQSDLCKYKGDLLIYLGSVYHEFGWVQQYHIGAHRNNSDRMFEKLGPNSGFDSINDSLIAKPLRDILNRLDLNNNLPKTIIYTLNPRDFEVAITLMQSFQGGGIAGKLQFGASWWFLDHKNDIEKHLSALGSNGVLSRFIGMLTDSRSFLSFSRHDYFRRILCNYVAEQVNNGLYPEDMEVLSRIVTDISYYNAKKYFGF